MDFSPPPPGPPPPKVPQGWKAQWNDQYKEWFYVNIYTKKSQWEKPTEPIYPPDDEAPGGPPPGYSGSGNPTGDTKHTYDASRGSGSTGNVESDAALAARLQAEEDARAGKRSAQEDYQNTPMPQSYPQTLPAREEKSRGLFSKLLGKTSSSNNQYSQGGQYGGSAYNRPPQQAYGYGQQQYPPQGYPQQGYPPQGYQQGYGAPQQQYYQQQQAPQKHGMGTMGGAALGLGGGLIGGMLLEDAISGEQLLSKA
jgi:hypothetical protein